MENLVVMREKQKLEIVQFSEKPLIHLILVILLIKYINNKIRDRFHLLKNQHSQLTKGFV